MQADENASSLTFILNQILSIRHEMSLQTDGERKRFFSSVFSYIFVFVFSFRQQSKRPLPTTDDLLFLRVRLEIFVFSPACLSAAV